MKLFLLLLFPIFLSAQAVPNPSLTPGSVRRASIHELCTTKTGLVRKVKAVDRRQAFINYGIDCAKVKCGKLYEIDHLISLEISGDNSLANLWPQPYAGKMGARAKDVLENKLHKMICSGEITPKQAQHEISHDWPTAYRRYVRKSDVKLPR